MLQIWNSILGYLLGLIDLDKYTVEIPDDNFSFAPIDFQLGDGIRCLEPEAQNTELSLEVAKIQFSISGL